MTRLENYLWRKVCLKTVGWKSAAHSTATTLKSPAAVNVLPSSNIFTLTMPQNVGFRFAHPTYDAVFSLYRIDNLNNIILCLIICFIFMLPSLTHGKDVCDPQLEYEKNSITAYKQRSPDKPCEGFYTSKVSGSSLEIVGLSMGRLTFDASQIRQLTISSPLIKNQQIKVRAVGIPLKIYYRMDAELAPGKSMTWPLEDVLTKMHVMGSEIGLFGRLAERPEIYVPLAVGNPKNEAIILSFRAAVDISEAFWRYSTLEKKNVPV